MLPYMWTHNKSLLMLSFMLLFISSPSIWPARVAASPELSLYTRSLWQRPAATQVLKNVCSWLREPLGACLCCYLNVCAREMMKITLSRLQTFACDSSRPIYMHNNAFRRSLIFFVGGGGLLVAFQFHTAINPFARRAHHRLSSSVSGKKSKCCAATPR